MNEDLKKYYDNLQKPWSQLFYDVVQHQLSFAERLDVLDFGSGFGKLADALSKNNTVIAIEPNKDMVKYRFKNNKYAQLTGGLPELKNIPDNSFDLIVCHNVLEYALERKDIIGEFFRVLRTTGLYQ